mgnify:FL=1
MTEFKKFAQETLDKIFNLVESNYENFEVDYEEENLRIDSLKNNNTYIVSIHSPTSQIWLSSPISGAHHFEMKTSNNYDWISTRDNDLKLIDLLKKELSDS